MLSRSSPLGRPWVLLLGVMVALLGLPLDAFVMVGRQPITSAVSVSRYALVGTYYRHDIIIIIIISSAPRQAHHPKYQYTPLQYTFQSQSRAWINPRYGMVMKERTGPQAPIKRVCATNK